MAVSEYQTTKSGYTYLSGPQRFTASQREKNALVIAQIMRGFGWTDNCIAGILGNMQSESGCNPGAYYGYSSFSAVSFGLVQWDPTSKYQTWADNNGYLPYHDIEYQCERIKYELENGIQYYNRDYGDYAQYNLTASEFTHSTLEPYYLACVFAWNYERSAVVLNGTATQKEALRKQRGGQANDMYALISGSTPPTPDPGPDTPSDQGSSSDIMPFLTYLRRRRYVVR